MLLLISVIFVALVGAYFIFKSKPTVKEPEVLEPKVQSTSLPPKEEVILEPVQEVVPEVEVAPKPKKAPAKKVEAPVEPAQKVVKKVVKKTK